MRACHRLLSVVALLSLVALGLGTIAMAALLILLPFGVSVNTHPLLWRCVLVTCVAAVAGMLGSYFLSRLTRFIAPRAF